MPRIIDEELEEKFEEVKYDIAKTVFYNIITICNKEIDEIIENNDLNNFEEAKK